MRGGHITVHYPSQDREQNVWISTLSWKRGRSGGVYLLQGFIMGFMGGHRLTSNGAGRRRPALGFDGGGNIPPPFF